MQLTKIDSYLSDRLDQHLRLVSLKPSAVGLSRETWFVRLVDTGTNAETALVVRMDSPFGAACFTSLEFEYEIYRRLNTTSLPTPAALWFEDDPGHLLDGRPFYVREYVAGEVEPAGINDPDPRHDNVRIRVAKEHASKLAEVHGLDWRSLGFDDLLPAPAPEDAAASALEVLREQMAEFQYRPLPLFDHALSWLEAHPPPPPAATVLLKGSNGIGQEVWRDGRIVALCDWELASLGDPARDWARARGCLPELDRWQPRDTLAVYTDRSGFTVTEESLRYYRVFYYAEMMAVCHRAGLPAQQGQQLSPQLEQLATAGLKSTTMGLEAALLAAQMEESNPKP